MIFSSIKPVEKTLIDIPHSPPSSFFLSESEFSSSTSTIMLVIDDVLEFCRFDSFKFFTRRKSHQRFSSLSTFTLSNNFVVLGFLFSLWSHRTSFTVSSVENSPRYWKRNSKNKENLRWSSFNIESLSRWIHYCCDYWCSERLWRVDDVYHWSIYSRCLDAESTRISFSIVVSNSIRGEFLLHLSQIPLVQPKLVSSPRFSFFFNIFKFFDLNANWFISAFFQCSSTWEWSLFSSNSTILFSHLKI